MEKIISGDNEIVMLLLLFITMLLTKRIVPWWLYEETLKKLKEYEEAAPELITETRRLMELLGQDTAARIEVAVKPKPPVRNPKIKPQLNDKVSKIQQRRLKGQARDGE